MKSYYIPTTEAHEANKITIRKTKATTKLVRKKLGWAVYIKGKG